MYIFITYIRKIKICTCVFQVFHCFFVAIMIVKVNFIFQYTGYNAVVMVDSSTDYLLHKAIYF